MNQKILYASTALIFFIAISTGQACAQEIKVAVSSNFINTLAAIVQQFEQNTDHKVTLIPGSSGKHYAQIINGAPYDAFFAADSYRAQRLEQENFALSGSRFTYAIGKLVLWSPENNSVIVDIEKLPQQPFRYLAIANPDLAPYGKAARQVLQAHNVWEPLKNRLVRGENIAQTYQFIKTGNANLGFVAYSQLIRPGQSIEGSHWLVPQNLYDPIVQQAVLLSHKKLAREFLNYTKSDDALSIIRAYGYATP